MEFKHNGVTLAYDYLGKGDYSFLFIHGVGANRQFFAAMAQHFSQYARVLNADLRGHGASDKPDQPYTMETYADDLGALAKAVKLDNIIVVGHSMGGNIALEFADRHADQLKGVVLLDAWLYWTPSALAFFAERLQELKSPQFKEHLRKLADMRCLPTDSHKDLVLQSFLATPQSVWCSSLENMRQWDADRTAATVKNCRVPLLYIQTGKPLVDQEKMEKDFHGGELLTGKVVGTGHFCNLEIPEQVDAMIDRFVNTYIEKSNAKK